MRTCALLVLAAALLAAGLGQAHAQSVALAGVLGQRALVVVDGAGPRTLAVGESWRGVRVLALQGDQADVDINGRRATVRLGASPVGMAAAGGTRRLVLQADRNGHYTGQGRINNQLMQFMVDTGASTVALGAAEAERLGLPFRNGPPVRVGTANGAVQGWAVRIAVLRIGDIDLADIEAIVVPQPMPFVLLGNNVLGRFTMTRGPENMMLEQRY